MISFNTIPLSLRVPGQYIEFDSSKAVSGLAAIENRVLVVGQKLDSGAAAALSIEEVVSSSEGIAKFGRGSILARMLTAYRKADNYSPVYAIALDDADGATSAAGTVTVTGPAAANGTIALMVAGVRIPVTVAAEETAITVAAKIVAAIAAKLDLPVTAAVGADPNEHVVTLTARNAGSAGNAIDIRHSHNQGEALPDGIGLAIVAMAGGAGDPDIDDIWAVIGDGVYRSVIVGLIDDDVATKLKAELDDRWGYERMLESVGYAAMSGSQGTLAAFGATQNSELITILGTGSSPTWPAEAAAIYGAACGYYTALDPARPTQTLELTGMVAPRDEEQFTRAQRAALLGSGIATFVCDTDGTCRIERSITTYQYDANNVESEAYLDLETVTTLAYLRATLRTRIATKYPRCKLADDGTKYGAGQAIVTPSIIKAEIIALAGEWEDAGLVEDIDQFKTDLIIERSTTDVNRVNALIPPDLVNQFRGFAASIQFRL